MGARRRTLLLGFVVALFLGFAIYFRLWAIDNESFSADDREVLRSVGFLLLVVSLSAPPPL